MKILKSYENFEIFWNFEILWKFWNFLKFLKFWNFKKNFRVFVNRRWSPSVPNKYKTFIQSGRGIKNPRKRFTLPFLKFKYGTFLTLSLKLMQWYVTSVSRGSLYEKFSNKCVKILKFWRTELSYAQNKNRGRMMCLLGMDTCPSLNDIMEIRCNKCTRSEQGYDF